MFQDAVRGIKYEIKNEKRRWQYYLDIPVIESVYLEIPMKTFLPLLVFFIVIVYY